MANSINLPDIACQGPWAHGFFEDFDHIISLDRWTKVIDTGGTALVIDGAGGIVQLTGDGTDEDATLIVTTAELFLVADGKPIIMQTRLKVTEANTDDANIAFGVSDVVTADLLVDADAGPAVSFDGAMIYKVGGGSGVDPTLWKTASSNATAQTLTTTEHAHVDTAWHTLRIQIDPVNSTTAEVTFFIDTAGGVDFQQMRRNGSNPREPAIKHNLTITGLAEMHAFVMLKNGSANAEVLDVDYFSIWQKR